MKLLYVLDHETLFFNPALSKDSLNIITKLNGSIAIPIVDGKTNPSSFHNSSFLGDFHLTSSF